MARRSAQDRRAPNPSGSVEPLPSGRFRAKYRHEGQTYTAPHTFPTRDAALSWLATERADRVRGTWRDPHAGQVNLSDYLADWLAARRPHLAERTATSYAAAVSAWIAPELVTPAGRVELGALNVSQLTPAVVRRWYAIMSEVAADVALQRLTYIPSGHPARRWAQAHGIPVPESGRVGSGIVAAWEAAGSPPPPRLPRPGAVGVAPGRATAARAYQVLHAACAQAVDDGLLASNPCRIAGAATMRPRERGTLTPAEVFTLAEAMPAHLRAAVVVAAWSGLRYGELFALARRHVDLAAGTLRVERALTAGRDPNGHTKTRGSVRTVYLPGFVTEALRDHLDTHTGRRPDALVFATQHGKPICSRNLSRTFARARAAIGRPELHWHDLRHTGATLAYREAGASVRDVQRRLGHTTARAAMIYAHAADDSDRLIAQRLDAAYGAHGNVIPLTRRGPLDYSSPERIAR